MDLLLYNLLSHDGHRLGGHYSFSNVHCGVLKEGTCNLAITRGFRVHHRVIHFSLFETAHIQDIWYEESHIELTLR